jgi:hypothetical protein
MKFRIAIQDRRPLNLEDEVALIVDDNFPEIYALEGKKQKDQEILTFLNSWFKDGRIQLEFDTETGKAFIVRRFKTIRDNDNS